MLRVIDRHNGFVIQKVVTPRGKCLGYQTKPDNAADADLVSRFDTLVQARNAIAGGFAMYRMQMAAKDQGNLTKPKSEYMQNQPGYRAEVGKQSKKRG